MLAFRVVKTDELLITIHRYRCTGCGHVSRQDTSRAAGEAVASRAAMGARRHAVSALDRRSGCRGPRRGVEHRERRGAGRGQVTFGHRGRKGDPFYAARRTLHTGAALLTEKQQARLEALFAVSEHVEVEATWGITPSIASQQRAADRYGLLPEQRDRERHAEHAILGGKYPVGVVKEPMYLAGFSFREGSALYGIVRSQSIRRLAGHRHRQT